MKTVKSYPYRYTSPLYAKAGRLVHTFSTDANPTTRVTDDFGNSRISNDKAVLFFVRGPEPAYQPEH